MELRWGSERAEKLKNQLKLGSQYWHIGARPKKTTQKTKYRKTQDTSHKKPFNLPFHHHTHTMNYSFNDIGPSSVPVHPVPAAAAAAPPSSNASSAAFHPYGALAPSNQQSSHLATGALAFVPPYAAAAASVSYSYEDEDDDDLMPWERDGWVPLEKSGKQKTPNKIRGELQRYIDSCKAGKNHRLSCSSRWNFYEIFNIRNLIFSSRWDYDADSNH